MNIGFYFAVTVCILLLLGRKTKTCLTVPADSTEVFHQDRVVLSRVAAALLIVCGHVKDRIGAYPNFPEILNKINLGGYWVAVFFLLSGYGLIYSVKHKKDYMHKFLTGRLAKILIPYATAHILYYFVKRITGTTFTPKEIVLGILGKGYIVDFSWYPIVIILLYILFKAAWSLNLKEQYKISLIVLGNIAITFMLWALLKGLEWWYLSNLAFSAGVILYYVVHSIKISTPMLIISGLILAIGGGVFMIPLCHRIFGSGVQIIYYILSHNVAKAGMALAVITALSVVSVKKSNIVSTLGRISYEIYLMHGLVIYLLMKWEVYESPWLFLGCAIICSIFLALLMNHIDRKLINIWNKNAAPLVHQ